MGMHMHTHWDMRAGTSESELQIHITPHSKHLTRPTCMQADLAALRKVASQLQRFRADMDKDASAQRQMLFKVGHLLAAVL